MSEALDQAACLRLELPQAKRSAGFISDLHLSPELPHTLAAWEALLLNDCDGLAVSEPLFILGDLFEAWPGDDVMDAPFEAQCVSLLAQAAQRRPVYVMRGNRDFLLGTRFFEATGCTELPDRVALHGFGQTALLCHGDELCLADTAYQQFRAMVRQVAWQSQFLSMPLPQRQAIAQQARSASRSKQQEAVTYADADPSLAARWLQEAQATCLVHGHTHRPGDDELVPGIPRHVLSDWDLDHTEPPRAELMRWSAEGWQRSTLLA